MSAGSVGGSGVSYQSIREQLVSLNVDLEDRSKLFDALTEKVDEARSDLSRIERDCERKYSQILNEEAAKFARESEEFTQKNNAAIARKKELIEECRALVEQVKRGEEELSTILRNIHSKTLRDIEADRKSFKLGREERQQKFLAIKQREIMEKTERALEPEFSRLRIANEQELAEVEMRLAIDEKKALNDIQKQFEERVQSEERAFKEAQRNQARLQLDETIREVENLEREHKIKLEQLSDDYQRETERYKQGLNKKIQKEMEAQEASLKEIETIAREKINELKARHEQDIRALEHDHSRKMKSLQQFFNKKKKDYRETYFPNESHRDSDSENSQHSLTSPSRRSSSGKETLQSYTTAERQLYEKLKKEANETKAKQLKAEIRKLHIESSELEREVKMKSETELKRVREAAENEERHLLKKQENLMKELSELTDEKSELQRAIKVAMDELTTYQSQARGKRTFQALQETIAEKKKELEAKYQEKMDQISRSSELIAKDFQYKAKEIATQREAQKKEHEALVEKLEREHEIRLQTMNEDVRREIAKKDEEKELLLDALQTEKIRGEKLKKMLQKYT